MLTLTSHSLRQAWEFPVRGPAPARCNQDNSNFGFLSSYLLCSPSCSWYHFSHSHEVLGIKSTPAFGLEQDKRGFLGEKQEPSCKYCMLHSGTIINGKRGERNPATSPCMISVPLASGLTRKMAANSSVKLSAFSSGLQLQSGYTSAVKTAAQQQHKQHSLYMPSILFQGVRCTFLLWVFGDCHVNTYI